VVEQMVDVVEAVERGDRLTDRLRDEPLGGLDGRLAALDPALDRSPPPAGARRRGREVDLERAVVPTDGRTSTMSLTIFGMCQG
jgi:hypothetical protein